jgi:predicted Ser/Thr protein kinase
MQIGGHRLEQGSELGGYRIEEPIGQGGMGVVYRVTNVALGRVYALKLLAPALAEDEQFRRRFQREMRIAASLHHPHVVGIHYAGEQDGLLFLAMDYVEGTDLHHVLAKEGALDPARAVELLTQVASALDAAHANGLVHRDVKPANVLITTQDGVDHAYLTDFGLAKRSDTLSGLTVQGNVVGTCDYMAPEQVTGERTDARTDVYALACVFFRMLTGKVPYERDTSVATLFAHVHDPPPALTSPVCHEYPEFGQVLERAMAKQPNDRYLSAGDFARDAEEALRGGRYTSEPSMVAVGDARPADATGASAEAAPTGATRTSAAARSSVAPPPAGGSGGGARAWISRHRWPVLALLAVVVAAAVVVGVLAATSSSSKPQLFEAILRPVADNHVTGSGTAAVRLDGSTATFTLDATGLLAGHNHQMHVHAFGEGICPPPSAAKVYNGHLAISTGDGLKYYGPMAVALTLSGDTSPTSMLAFTRYPSAGTIHYQRTLQVTSATANAIRNGNAVIVIHGIDYNHNGVYDNVLNKSDVDSSVPQEETAPALCGTLVSPRSVGLSG